MQIIINAGGTGTRLWPYSTGKVPKQFVPLIDDTNFLRKTYDRIVSDNSQNNVWVNTNEKFESLVKNSLPNNFLKSNILTEPEKRDNFAAIVAHAAVVAYHTTDTEPLIFVHADHLIQQKDWQKFCKSLRSSAKSLINQDFEIITAGVRPKSANTQLGYIEIRVEDITKCFESAVTIKQFKEKPDQFTANKFLKAGNFLWNLGYFSFTYDTLIKNISRYTPEILDVIKEIRKTGVITQDLYKELPKTTFDYAIAEKSESLGVIGIDIDWEDIGNWQIAAKYLPEIKDNKNLIQIEGQNNKVKSPDKERKVAFVGVSDLILVESEEGLLVVNPEYSAEVKKVAKYFESLS
ncbi:MAG: sugar phosphate nucleotidyltransferase [Patescibacteria group bacterium]